MKERQRGEVAGRCEKFDEQACRRVSHLGAQNKGLKKGPRVDVGRVRIQDDFQAFDGTGRIICGTGQESRERNT